MKIIYHLGLRIDNAMILSKKDRNVILKNPKIMWWLIISIFLNYQILYKQLSFIINIMVDDATLM